jgi:RNA polymerase primary sigma factor
MSDGVNRMLMDIKDPSAKERIPDQSGIVADDSVSLYLNEMKRVPLLSREEEVALAKKMEIGHRASDALLESGGSPENLAELEEKIRAGEEARSYLIKANIRLVVNIAKKYRRYASSFLDLIQAGNVGLIRAVDKFDHTLGNRFSTYATWWIRRSVLRHLNLKERTIRLPNYLSTRIRKVHKIRQKLAKKLSREPTAEEVAAHVEQTPEEVRRLLKVARRAISLDTPTGEDGETFLQNIIENKNAPDPFIEVNLRHLEEDVLASLDVLTEREARIIELRYGLGGVEPHSLKALGKIFGVTRERIRQLQQQALRKLRHPQVSKKLRVYL